MSLNLHGGHPRRIALLDSSDTCGTPVAFFHQIGSPSVARRFASSVKLGWASKRLGPSGPTSPTSPAYGPHGSHGGPSCQAKVGSTTASRTLSIYASAVEGRSGPKSGKMPEELDELDELDVPLPCQGKGKEKRKKKTALAALARLKAVANVGDST